MKFNFAIGERKHLVIDNKNDIENQSTYEAPKSFIANMGLSFAANIAIIHAMEFALIIAFVIWVFVMVYIRTSFNCLNLDNNWMNMLVISWYILLIGSSSGTLPYLYNRFYGLYAGLCTERPGFLKKLFISRLIFTVLIMIPIASLLLQYRKPEAISVGSDSFLGFTACSLLHPLIFLMKTFSEEDEKAMQEDCRDRKDLNVKKVDDSHCVLNQWSITSSLIKTEVDTFNKAETIQPLTTFNYENEENKNDTAELDGDSDFHSSNDKNSQDSETSSQQQPHGFMGQEQTIQESCMPNQITPQQDMAQQKEMQMHTQIQPQPTSSLLQRQRQEKQEALARLYQCLKASSPEATPANPSPTQKQLGDGNQAQAQLQRERSNIWNGCLEWNEKEKSTPEDLKILRQLTCQVSTSVVNNDNEPEVKGDGWPSKLFMQLIPKQIVGNLGGNYFVDVKTVLFILQNCDALVSLTKVMDSGYAGCVHFRSEMAQNPCTIKVLILLYSKERHAFLGFIPNDQAGFVDRLRKVIQQKKAEQAAIRQGTTGIPPNIIQNFGPTPGQGGMQGGMVIQGQDPEHQHQGGFADSPQQMSEPNMIQIQTAASEHQEQLVTIPSQIPSSGPDSIELKRQQNVLKIQQLKAQLEQAQRLICIQPQDPTAKDPGSEQIVNPGKMGMSADVNNKG